MRKILFVLLLVLVLAVGFVYASMPKSRHLEFDYEVFVKDIPAGTSELKIWLPHLPQTSYQKVEDVRINPPGIARVAYDKTFQNKILFYLFKSPREEVKIDVRYRIRRYEFSKKPVQHIKNKFPKERDLTKYLVSNRLVTISPQIKELAGNITRGKITTLQKARAIYDYVFENVSYDKTIPGWGNGDTERVCRVKAGNCTDFHSLFISLARASHIPAKFVMGASVPKQDGGEIKGYHCWAEFYDDNLGWVPVDISEAWKDKSKREYFFGTINEDRLEFSQGRDIVLEPVVHGEPLNYFLYPYVEVDGKNFNNINVSFRFKDKS